MARITFGRFCIVPHRRELLSNDRPIMLGSRAFDVLMALIEAHGFVVSKDALMARVWPNQVVEENNLEVQISMLRAAFGAERALIRTVPGRGYQFTGDVRFPAKDVEAYADARPISAEPGFAAPATNLPQPVTELIGRDDSLLEILRLAVSHRLVTLTGAGGIGKTRLALAAAHRLLPQFSDGVWIVELASLTDSSFVPVAISTAVGLEFADGAVTAERVANALSGKKMLLVLDTCEHVIEAAALAAEALVRANAAAHVITTSRELLRADGEQTYAVPPLDVPAAGIDDKTDLLEYSAVRLFVERVRAVAPQFAPDRRTGAVLALICRQLDGIPLAIELAAARVAALGIREVASRLGDRLSLLTGGRRTALPRHQTLRATLDWSYELLPERERLLLRSLGVFVGSFSLAAINAVAAAPVTTVAGIVDELSSLAAKSLVVSVVWNDIARYRLLDTTRAYALEKLNEGGEREWAARRHAEYYRNLFERAEAEWQVRSTAEWLGEFGWQIDNLRVALDWAFSPNGDVATGVALTAAAMPLWMHLSLLTECHERIERALAIGASLDARHEMRLSIALGTSLMYQRGAVPGVVASYRRALEIAENLNDGEYQLRARWGLWGFYMVRGEWRVGFEHAQSVAALAADQTDPNNQAIADRVIGFSLHYLGDQMGARQHIEHMLADFALAVGRSDDTIRFHFDQRVVSRSMLGRILWLQGFPDQARRITESAVEDARGINAITMWGALIYGAFPVSLWIGDLSTAERYIDILLEYSSRYGLHFFRGLGRCFQGLLLIKRDGITRTLSTQLADFDEAVASVDPMFHVMFRCWMANALASVGQVTEGLTTLEPAIDRAARSEECWLHGELLRIKGELSLLQSREENARMAEDWFRKSLDTARRQDTLSFELRAAVSLARLWRDQNRREEALALLQPVYDRFSEGFETADLKSARALLDFLR